MFTRIASSFTRPFARTFTRAYSDQVVNHFHKPNNVGTMNKYDKDVGTAIVGAPACGDVIKMQIRVGPDGKITDAKMKVFGCGSAIASTSLATELVKGRTLEEAEKITNVQIQKALDLAPVKLHCSMLAEDGIRMAIEDFRKKQK